MSFEGLRGYAQAATDLSSIARARLLEVVREALRGEVERAGGAVGLAGAEEVARLRRTVERLERRVAALEQATGTGSPADRPARRASSARPRASARSRTPGGRRSRSGRAARPARPARRPGPARRRRPARRARRARRHRRRRAGASEARGGPRWGGRRGSGRGRSHDPGGAGDAPRRAHPRAAPPPPRARGGGRRVTSEHPPGSPGAGPAREVLEAGTGDPAVDAALQPLRDLLAAGGPGPGADPGRDLRVLTDVHDALARRLAGSAG